MTGFTLSHELLLRLAARNAIEVPQAEIVLFGLRGLLPLNLGGTGFAPGHPVRLADLDHQRMRCTIGQWRVAEGTLAVFPGSTVPNRSAIATAKANGGRGANQLMLGRYRYQKGVHKAGSPNGHRAFRQAMFFPVWRTVDDLDFDQNDKVDFGDHAEDFVFDNLHCAFHDSVETPGFSSNGCQVVSGHPMSPRRNMKPETGAWRGFIDSLYNDEVTQTRFDYLLLTGSDAAQLARTPDREVRPRLLFGSSGELVKTVQRALQDKDFDSLEPDGKFGRDTLQAVMTFQIREFGPGQADGLVGPNTATALGLNWPATFAATGAPSHAPAAPAPAPPPPVVPATPAATMVLPEGWQESAITITCGFETQGDPFEGVAGDFDGMGVSCGALQWNIGKGSLQPMVVALGEASVKALMPQLGAEFWQACNASITRGLAIVRGFQNGTRLTPTARSELKALMGSPAMRAEQVKKIAKLAERAHRMANAWAEASGGSSASKRLFLWFFDLATQNGSLEGLTPRDVADFIALNTPERADDVVCDFLARASGSVGHVRDAQRNAELWRGRANDEQLALLVASFLRSETADRRFRHVVLNRKGSIAMGTGNVNSQLFDFARHLA